jgi:hypothetical protein
VACSGISSRILPIEVCGAQPQVFRAKAEPRTSHGTSMGLVSGSEVTKCDPNLSSLTQRHSVLQSTRHIANARSIGSHSGVYLRYDNPSQFVWVQAITKLKSRAAVSNRFKRTLLSIRMYPVRKDPLIGLAELPSSSNDAAAIERTGSLQLIPYSNAMTSDAILVAP